MNVQVFSLKGEVAGLSLDTQTFVLVSYSLQPFETPRARLLYVSDKLDPEMLVPISRLFIYGLNLSPSNGIRRAVIYSSFSPKAHKVTIPGVLEYEVIASEIEGGRVLDSGLRTILYPWLRDPEQWVAGKIELTIDSEKTVYQGTNAIEAGLSYSEELIIGNDAN